MLSGNSVTRWMDQAGKYKLLSHEEVLEIAGQRKASTPGSHEYKSLVNKLVVHNLKLVITFVERYMSTKVRSNFGSDITGDYLQQGVIGLIRAAEKYEPDMGYRFSTYAYFWMRSHVGRYALKESTLFHVSEGDMRKAYAHETGKATPNKARNWLSDAAFNTSMVRSAQCSFSIYESLTEHSFSLVDVIPAPAQASPREPDKFVPDIEEAMETAGLTEFQKEILRCIYIDGRHGTELARMAGMSDAQFKLAKSRALRKLRRTMPADILTA